MSVTSRLITYASNTTELEGFFACDDGDSLPKPAVLIAHMWAGRVPFVDEKAKALAEQGYAAMSLDMYGKGVLGSSVEENAGLMQPFMDDRRMVRERMLAALETLKAQPEVDPNKIVVIGYCFGGLCALDLARSGADIKGAVSFHGLLTPPTPLKTEHIKAKILVLHGDQDPMAPNDQVQSLRQEFTKAGADWQIHLYGNKVHAFTNPVANDPDMGTIYDADADRRSAIALKNFLEEVFS